MDCVTQYLLHMIYGTFEGLSSSWSKNDVFFWHFLQHGNIPNISRINGNVISKTKYRRFSLASNSFISAIRRFAFKYSSLSFSFSVWKEKSEPMDGVSFSSQSIRRYLTNEIYAFLML